MKYVIKESRVTEIILKYLENNYLPDYNWQSNSFYMREVKLYGYFDFTIEDDSAYIFVNDIDTKHLPNSLVIRPRVGRTLDGLFGDVWRPIFVKWFEKNTGLSVENFEVETN